ncbi:hypothetical protein [Scytonema millei]|uniref:Uncharacterized protein n=1 Tax=Scytonema millei VB511283 TaxID=1245923 RepID=A0A9X5E7E3_9CYAN|nr:hypothetical protein [Scytonema millei]NHC35367.1 hypothetical protein [Scytonema millei VB511283]
MTLVGDATIDEFHLSSSWFYLFEAYSVLMLGCFGDSCNDLKVTTNPDKIHRRSQTCVATTAAWTCRFSRASKGSGMIQLSVSFQLAA